jgi:hypothetical protein
VSGRHHGERVRERLREPLSAEFLVGEPDGGLAGFEWWTTGVRYEESTRFGGTWPEAQADAGPTDGGRMDAGVRDGGP